MTAAIIGYALLFLVGFAGAAAIGVVSGLSGRSFRQNWWMWLPYVLTFSAGVGLLAGGLWEMMQ